MKKILLFSLISCLVFMTACSPLERVIEFFSDDGTGYIFKISLSDDPEILDPQIATDESSIAILKNMFVGLLKQDSDGTISTAGASDYTISADGLTYTFYLDERYAWKTTADWEGSVTAYDYEFAFRRLFSPETGSPYASDYFSILNSEAAYNGEAELTEIGVHATDDYTLVITLEYPNAEFLSLLTRLPASPCNEEFFESCKGKYGLEAECIASNGAFYVRYWLHEEYSTDNYVRLRRNDYYSEFNDVYPYGVNYLIESDEAVRLSDFTGGTTDVYISSTFESSLEESTYRSYSVYFCGLVINPENEILSRTEVAEIISMAIDREALDTETPDILTAAYGIIPYDAYVGSSNYRKSADSSLEDILIYNEQLAEYKWSFTLTDSEKLTLYGLKIMVPDTFEYTDYLSLVTGMLNDTLGIGVGIDIVNESDYASRLASGDYEICLVEIESSSGSAFDYIEAFSDGTYGISSEGCAEAVESSGKYSTLSSAIYAISEAEKDIISSYQCLPLWYAEKFVFTADDVSGLEYDVFSGAAIFETVKKQ
ncbi:MAG: ABC transporter substrate-binding protein [Oscillospiraceae bacterium]|nr:ABC transporter substrate-binding protein [Oscillospiraceae bacterium]